MKGLRLTFAVPFAWALAVGALAKPGVDCLRPKSVAEKMACVGMTPSTPTNGSETTRTYRSRLTDDGPELRFVAHFDVEPELRQLAIRRIDVFEPKNDRPRETLQVEGDSFLPEDLDPLRFDDLNFDGFADLAVTVDAGATGNTQSVYWLYDPQAKRFARAAELDALPTLLPDPETQRLRTHWKGGHAGAVYTRAEYRWRGRTLELVREESQEVDPKSADGDVFVRVIRERKGGKLREVAKKRLRYSPQGKEIQLR